jgi:hypothetical protein
MVMGLGRKLLEQAQPGNIIELILLTYMSAGTATKGKRIFFFFLSCEIMIPETQM